MGKSEQRAGNRSCDLSYVSVNSHAGPPVTLTHRGVPRACKAGLLKATGLILISPVHQHPSRSPIGQELHKGKMRREAEPRLAEPRGKGRNARLRELRLRRQQENSSRGLKAGAKQSDGKVRQNRGHPRSISIVRLPMPESFMNGLNRLQTRCQIPIYSPQRRPYRRGSCVRSRARRQFVHVCRSDTR